MATHVGNSIPSPQSQPQPQSPQQVRVGGYNEEEMIKLTQTLADHLTSAKSAITSIVMKNWFWQKMTFSGLTRSEALEKFQTELRSMVSTLLFEPIEITVDMKMTTAIPSANLATGQTVNQSQISVHLFPPRCGSFPIKISEFKHLIQSPTTLDVNKDHCTKLVAYITALFNPKNRAMRTQSARNGTILWTDFKYNREFDNAFDRAFLLEQLMMMLLTMGWMAGMHHYEIIELMHITLTQVINTVIYEPNFARDLKKHRDYVAMRRRYQERLIAMGLPQEREPDYTPPKAVHHYQLIMECVKAIDMVKKLETPEQVVEFMISRHVAPVYGHQE
jgi:hypothetical protein